VDHNFPVIGRAKGGPFRADATTKEQLVYYSDAAANFSISRHFPHRLDRQLQHLAQRLQVCAIWTPAICFPPIDRSIAYIHLRRDIPNPELLLLASAADMISEGGHAWHVNDSFSTVALVST
jgi:hypothetical protein